MAELVVSLGPLRIRQKDKMTCAKDVRCLPRSERRLKVEGGWKGLRL